MPGFSRDGFEHENTGGFPEDFLTYQDLYWKLRDEGIDIRDSDQVLAYLEAADTTQDLLDQKKEFLELTEADIDFVLKKIGNIKSFSAETGIPESEVFLLRDMPSMIPEGADFRIWVDSGEKVQCIPTPMGVGLFKKITKPSPELAKSSGSDGYIMDGRAAGFKWIADVDGHEVDLDHYEPGSRLGLRLFYGYSDGTALPVQHPSCHLSGEQKSPWNSVYLSGKVEFEVLPDGGGIRSLDSPENRRIRALRSVFFEEDAYKESSLEGLNAIQDFMETDISEEDMAIFMLRAYSTPQALGRLARVESSAQHTRSLTDRLLRRPIPEQKTFRKAFVERLRNQYLSLSQLVFEIESYVSEKPNVTAREIFEVFFSPERLRDFSPEQVRCLMKGIESFCHRIRKIDQVFPEAKEDQKEFIETSFSLPKGSLSGDIRLEKGSGTIQIYVEDEGDYAKLNGDSRRAALSVGFATSRSSDPELSGAFIVIKTKDVGDLESPWYKSVADHEDRHQLNRVAMAEHLFAPLEERLNASTQLSNLSRAKDEIIAQFRGGDRTRRQIKETMTRDRGLYDYYYEKERASSVQECRSLLERINQTCRGQVLGDLISDEELSTISLDEDFIDYLEKARKKLKELLHATINYRSLEDHNPLFLRTKMACISLMKQEIVELDSAVLKLRSIDSSSADWEDHKREVRYYIGIAEAVLSKYPREGFHLLALTPLEHWKLL